MKRLMVSLMEFNVQETRNVLGFFVGNYDGSYKGYIYGVTDGGVSV